MKLTIHLTAFLAVGIITLGLKPAYILAFSGWIIVFEEVVYQEKQQAKKSKDA
jgi:hypothetical protein